MKFSCEKSAFLDAISISSRAVSTKSTIAILEGLRLTASDTLTLAGYDLTMGIQTRVDADVLEPGEIVLNARLLGDIVRKLPDDVVYFETDDKLLTTIKCGRSVFNLVATASDDFPAMPEVESSESIDLPERTLKSLINQTVFAVSDNQAKPIHTGCLFELVSGKLTVVAVDGFRLSVRREALENAPADCKFVVPGAALREIERILHEDGDKTASVCPGEKHILFSLGDTTLVCRLIDGEFLNYNAAIPNAFSYTVTANTRELITCIERVSLLVSERLKNPVRITFDGSMMKMTCITAVGKSYDECPIGGDVVDEFEIGFNSRYLLDALRACGEETVQMSLKGPLNPIVLNPAEGDRYTYLVLPVRLRNDA